MNIEPINFEDFAEMLAPLLDGATGEAFERLDVPGLDGGLATAADGSKRLIVVSSATGTGLIMTGA